MGNDPQSADKLINMTAAVEGGYKPRTVRLNGKTPLCTSTYNFAQSEETKTEISRRIAALWNLAQGISTDDLETLDSQGFKFKKDK